MKVVMLVLYIPIYNFCVYLFLNNTQYNTTHILANELVINSCSDKVDIALISDKRLIELHRQETNSDFCVGDIYFGRVKKAMDGLNAAFVDVGYEKDGFLHYHDLGSQFRSLVRYIKNKKQLITQE